MSEAGKTCRLKHGRNNFDVEMKNFQDKVAVITGGAGGLGKEFALTAARLGMKVVIADINQQMMRETKAELEDSGAHVHAFQCDVRDETEVRQLADSVVKEFGTVNLLFNNAGVGCGGFVWENTLADWEWVMGVNLYGVVNCIRAFTPYMLDLQKKDKAFQGHIVNTASMAGLVNAPLLGIYNVSKHAVVALSESLYHDLKMVGAPVHVSVLCPYFVPTGISQSEKNRPSSLQNKEALTVSQNASHVLIEKAVKSGSVSAAQVAKITFDAIRDEQFYIFTHPESVSSIEQRTELMRSYSSPYNPYSEMPNVEKLVEQLINPLS